MLCGLRALHVRAPVSQENHVGVTLHVTYTDAYPDEPPIWELEEGKRERGDPHRMGTRGMLYWPEAEQHSRMGIWHMGYGRPWNGSCVSHRT